MARLIGAVPPGSYLVLSHGASDIDAEEMAEVARRINRSSHQQFTPRSHTEVTRFFDGLELLARRGPGRGVAAGLRPGSQDTHTVNRLVRSAGQTVPLVHPVPLLPPFPVRAPPSNSINGALMLLPRHRWSIDAVTAGQAGWPAGLPGRMRPPGPTGPPPPPSDRTSATENR